MTMNQVRKEHFLPPLQSYEYKFKVSQSKYYTTLLSLLF